MCASTYCDQGKRHLQRERALEEHARLSRLYREDRFAFERWRLDTIKRLIQSAPDPGLRKKLWELQARWDQRMNSAGPHNRLVLAKALFWDHVLNRWLPTLQEFSSGHTKKGLKA
ncbi:MAG: hypothetical protein DRH12_06505 [Deltaproteobacteria bacterium]|nr:MAG: hypothetical protein DRH12_06505 [Deltaproteobacteria bacterium]